jgi:hypothetical protein
VSNTAEVALKAVASAFAVIALSLWERGDAGGGYVAEILGKALADEGLMPLNWELVIRPDMARVADRDGWVCHYCQVPLGWGHQSVMRPEVDHKISRKNGGSHELSNKVLACGPCNATKSTKNHDDFCMRCCMPEEV